MRRLLIGIPVTLCISMTSALAQDIAAGSRVTVTSDWHSQNGGPYSPKIVSCISNSDLCLRDTNTSPVNNPMTKIKNGLQVVFKEFGVVYLFRSGGKGTFHDMSGKQTGKFSWSQ